MKTHMYMKRTVILYFLLLIELFVCCAKARPSAAAGFNISYVTVDDGLLANFIDDIYKDTQGFLWLSTTGGGLARYDGFEFVHYTISSSPVQLTSNFVSCTREDRFGRLWIATENGINILDKRLMKPTRPRDERQLLEPLLRQPAVNILSDTQGRIWVFGGTVLYCILFDETGGVADVLSTGSLPANRFTLAMNDVDKDGHIWIGTGQSISKVVPANEPHRLRLTAILANLPVRKDTYISAFVRKENDIWIGTSEDGLLRYNRNDNRWRHYRKQENNPHSLTHNSITDLAVMPDGRLLAGTLRGINIYLPANDYFEHLTQNESPGGKFLNSDFVNCLLVDNDRLWIGTETGGINLMSTPRLHVRNFLHNPNLPGSLSHNPVNAIYEDESKQLWVGTVEGGLNRRVAGTDSFVHYTSGAPAFLSHNTISAITADHAGRLWVGTWGNGVSRIDLRSPGFRTADRLTRQTVPGFPFFIGLLQYDAINRGMWIGSNPGIFFYDLETNRLFQPLDSALNLRLHGCIGAIIDRQERLWIGTMEGVVRIDLRSRGSDMRFSCVRFHDKLDKPGSGQSERVTCFCLTENGTLWIGSNGYGIYKYIPSSEKEPERFVNYTNEQGLINNTVRGMLEDRRGCLWISTINGLSRFDPQSGTFINYTSGDGLPNNQFYWNAYCKTSDGSLYFGGLQGLTCIDTGSRNMLAQPARVCLTRLFVAGKEVHPGNRYIDSHISMAGRLSLHESDKTFALEFSSLSYEPRPVSGFSYRLLNFDDQWSDTPATRRHVTYTNLPAGLYTFQVRYNAEGNPFGEAPVTELSILVSPYFYKTWWFISLLTAIGACILVVFYLRMAEKRISELKQKNVKIIRQQAQLVEMEKQLESLRLQVENLNDRKFLDKAAALMKAHYSDPDFEQPQFLSALGVSKSAANLRFRRLMDLSTGEFIRLYRLSVAYELIKESRQTHRMNISDIAYAVGFNDPKYFSRSFVKQYNITPTHLLHTTEESV